MIELEEFEGYSVTEDGRVFVTETGRELKQSESRGYKFVRLNINGVVKVVRVHRLVASAYLSPIDDKIIVNHIDCNKANNNVSNLEYCSVGENNIHAIAQGRRKVTRGVKDLRTGIEYVSIVEATEASGVCRSTITKHAKNRITKPLWRYTEPPIRETRGVINLDTLEEYSSVRQAARAINIHDTTVASAAKGILKTAAGFKWAYINIEEEK